MFKNVTGFSIQGGFYEKNTYMNNILSKRMNIVFGRNGSGKSSIANGFADQQDPNGPRKYCMSFLGGPNLPEVNSKNIFVFNEDFIDQKMKIEGELKSIVMFGDDIALDAKIRATEEEKARFESDKIEEDNKAIELANKATANLDDIKKKLRQGYIKRLQEVEGKSKNLTSTIIEEIIGLTPVSRKLSIDEYVRSLDAKIAEFHAYKTGNVLNSISNVPALDIKQINELLTKIVKPAELSKDEEEILSILSNSLGGSNYLERTSNDIVNTEIGFCPLCHQGISHDHRDELRKRLLRFRDETVDEFKT